MSDTTQKIAVAVISAIVGAILGFGGNFYFAQRGEAERQENLAKQIQIDFLTEMYQERKGYYLEIEEARFSAFQNPTNEKMDELVDAFASVPFVRPRLPTNNLILGFRDEIGEVVAGLTTVEERKEFLRFGMSKYMCLFDVNLQTIEGLMTEVIEASELQSIGVDRGGEDLALLDKVCFENL